MATKNESDYETVIIEGKVWAVTASGERSGSEESVVLDAEEPGTTHENEDVAEIEDSETASRSEATTDSAATAGSVAGSAVPAPADETMGEASGTQDAVEFDALKALTSLLVGGAIEGTSQLTARLQLYQEALRQEAAERDAEGGYTDAGDEDELVRLRYALVGLIFDAQATFRRNVSLWAKLADQSARATNWVARPVTNSFLFGPARRRYYRLVRRGEESLARWTADGRREEPPSRDLARMTYAEILNEFIDRLAENPELQAVITQQGIGVASDIRDEVRERTVSGDNLVEGLVRRILRRAPRAELPGPPPEVQRWAGLTLEEYRAQMQADERKDEPS